jgi:hypothetical protein
MRRLILHVDRVVLRGVAIGDVGAFTVGLQEELTRVLDAPAMFATVADADHHPPRRNTIDIPPAASATLIGQCVARGISKGLAR